MIDARQIEQLALRLRGLLVQLQRPAGVMRTVAEGVEHQTRRRIFFEKRAPDGTAWRPWSEAYARTRGPEHSLLIDTRAMVEGINSRSSTRTATIFSTRPYAGKNQATRPFLGISEKNRRDIEAWVGPALEAMAVEALKGLSAR